MSTAYSLDVGELSTLTCGALGCGIAFAIPSTMHSQRRRDGKYFYCPNGHQISYTDSENAKLQRQLERTQKELEWEQQASKRAKEETARIEKCRRATKGALTKIRQRIERGCCPKCSATFADLAAHMQDRHGVHPGTGAQRPL